MIARIEIRNNKVYLVQSGPDWNNPRIIYSFFETSADPDIVEDGAMVSDFNGTYIYRGPYKEIPLYFVDPEHCSTFVEFAPIHPPKKRGYKWSWGKWVKA